MNIFIIPGFPFVLILLFTSCFPAGLVLRPRPIEKTECSASPKLKSYNIKSIAVFPFIPSKKTEKGDYIPPYAKLKHNPIPKYIHFEDDGIAVPTELEKQLLRTYRFKVADRRKIKQVMEEIELQQTGLIDERYLKKIGKITGADAVINGKVNTAMVALQWQSYGDIVYAAYIAYVNVQLRMTHIETGEVVWICNIKRNSLNYIDKSITISKNEDIQKLLKIGGPGAHDLVMFVLAKAFGEAVQQLL